MAGLGEPMTYDVKMQKPTDLQSAMSLASLNSILSEIIKSCQIPLCKETSISFMQVASSKIIFRKSTWRKIFGEFLWILPNGLMLLKIQINFRFGYIPEFLIPNLSWIRSQAKKESCSSYFSSITTKFPYFLSKWSYFIFAPQIHWLFGARKIIWKIKSTPAR
jgi:hypothetical protein